MASMDGLQPRASGSIEAARRQRRISWTMALILAFIYFGYLFLIIFAPQAMAAFVGGNLTVGLVLGAGVIFAALILATYYVAQANRNDAGDARRS